MLNEHVHRKCSMVKKAKDTILCFKRNLKSCQNKNENLLCCVCDSISRDHNNLKCGHNLINDLGLSPHKVMCNLGPEISR